MNRRRPATSLFAAALALAALALAALPAFAADDQRAWSFNFAPGSPQVPSLAYSVPQTDDIQVTGSCIVFEGVGIARLTLGADVGKQAAGKELDVRFSGGGFDYVHAGTVVKALGENGISGVEVDAEAGDALWNAMTQSSGFDYFVPGGRAVSLDFTRGRDQVRKFQDACKVYAAQLTGGAGAGDPTPTSFNVTMADFGAGSYVQESQKSWVEKRADGSTAFHFTETARGGDGVMLYDPSRNVFIKLDIAARTVWHGQGVAPTTKLYAIASASSGPIMAAAPMVPSPPPQAESGPVEISCDQRGNLRPQNSHVATEISFDNKTRRDVVVQWIDFNGVAKDYGLLKPNDRKAFKTFVSHPWMIADLSGNCLQIEMPIANGSVAFVVPGENEAAPAPVYTAPKKAYVPPPKKKVVRKKSACPPGQYLEGATGICRKPGWANKPQTAKELKANNGCGRTQFYNPDSGQCEEDD